MTVQDRIQEIQSFFSETPLFQDLEDRQRNALAHIAVLQTYSKGDVLFWEGDEGTGFFIVKSGKIKVFKLGADGKEQILHFFDQGDHFAEVPAFDGGRFPASAAAISPATVIFIPRAPFLSVLQQHPTLAIALLGTFARHLRRLAHLVDSLSFKEVPERLAHYLLTLSERHEQSDVVTLDVPKSQLAALLGTIPETLSRSFNKLAQDGLIEVEGAQVRLCDRTQLIRLGQKDLA